MHYKIPTPLKRSILDHEIPLTIGGVNAKPVPMKVLMFWGVSIMALFWATTSTGIKDADWYLIAMVVILWIVLTGFFGQYSKTKEMKFSSVPALMNYAPKSSREVVTRMSSNPNPFYSVVGIDSVDSTGFIRFSDGTVGQAYLVVGSASVLVFEEDKRAILDRVDSFWKKVDTTAEYVWVTTKESQRVLRQLANLERQNRRLVNRDPELFALLDERHALLKDYVGGQFNSIHQYLLIKGDNLEALRKAHTTVEAEIEDSSRMIKACSTLDETDLYDMLRVFYTGAR